MPIGWKQITGTPAPPSPARGAVAPAEPRPEATGGQPGARPAASPRTLEEAETGRLELFVPAPPRRTLDDLILPEETRRQLDAALARLRHQETLYRTWNLAAVDPCGSRVGVNLYGPPGVGKTVCAEAIAAALGQQLISVSYAEIESKYVGETPKNIRAAFRKARETGAALFFDEADTILGKRLTHVTQSADHGVNVSRTVMLLELNSFTGLVMFASNLQGNYDPAFVRRIAVHIGFVLPDEDCRARLWRKLLPAELLLAPDVDVAWLAGASAGLSGGDLVNVVINAASRAVQRPGEAQRVSREDLVAEIGAVRQAARNVGTLGNLGLSTRQVPASELPSEVAAQLAAGPAGEVC
ncbi:MAG: ATP-binding protein [Myxococcota bacterium]|jgi:SpoVK/Ycf46/Vps4 family AAA+-type ATPase|nr:ATP-binding protein [Myxococcota bacterium]